MVTRIVRRHYYQFVMPGPRYLDIALDLLAQPGTAGNLTTNAQLAAIAIECDAEMFSNDKDFGRFPALQVGERPPIGPGRSR